MMVPEDFKYIDDNGFNQSNDKIGVEINGYLKYMLFKNVEAKFNIGYLFADDGMDYFEVDGARDGDSDENIFVSSARIRFKF